MSHSDFRGVPQARESSMSMLRDPSMAVLGLQQRLSSTYLTSNGEDPNQDQDSNLLDIIEAAESAIRTQVRSTVSHLKLEGAPALF